jgi:hypothetical protein
MPWDLNLGAFNRMLGDCGLEFSVPLTLNCLRKNGGDDGTRTRGLCRDRAAF